MSVGNLFAENQLCGSELELRGFVVVFTLVVNVRGVTVQPSSTMHDFFHWSVDPNFARPPKPDLQVRHK